MQNKRSSILLPKRTYLWEQAPEALLEKIAELSGILAKHKNNATKDEALGFYEELLKVMQVAHNYMNDTKWIRERNGILEANIRFLAQHNQELQERLDELQVVAKLSLGCKVQKASRFSDL